MSHADIKIIDPLQSKIPELAVVQKVLSDGDKLPEDQHDRAVKAFLVSDGIASGIGKDLAFVDKIPQFIKEIIDNKLWECLYVAKGVVTPYYCRYVKGTDSENFRAFITAKRPNGLETSVETIDRVLQADLEVQRQFRAIIYESRQGQRTDLIDDTDDVDDGTSPTRWGKLKPAQQEYLRAANRAAEAIPTIGELLDRGLISIKVAALLGRDIKDPKNLTAEEREYVDKRDLIGLRLNQYIYTNPIPEDEDKEPAYSRELNSFVKDLLGIKDRSKSIRMDHPKKAAEKLLQFYQGDKLKELIDHLRQGLQPFPTESPETAPERLASEAGRSNVHHNHQSANNNSHSPDNQHTTDKADTSTDASATPPNLNLPALKPAVDGSEKSVPAKPAHLELTLDDLAKRLNASPRTVRNTLYKDRAEFPQWSQKRDPEGIAWQQSKEKKGRSLLLVPISEVKQE